MKNQISIYVLNHGKFGEELIRSAELIVGKNDQFHAISLLAGMSIESFYEEVKKCMNKSNGKKIVLTDLYGGTPCNVAMMLQREFAFPVLCGVNLPMMIELALGMNHPEADIEALCNMVIQTGQKSIYMPKQIRIDEDKDI